MAMTPNQARVWELVEAGHSIQKITEITGFTYNATKNLRERARKWAEQDPAIRGAMEAVGTSTTPSALWVKYPPKDGEPGYSVYFKPTEVQEDKLSAIREAFDAMLPAPPIVPPRDVLVDLNAIYPVCDIHANMRALATYTGGDDYNLDLMHDDVLMAFTKVLARTPDSEEATLILNGDTLDTDNEVGTTPGHGHILPKDSGQHDALRRVVTVIRIVIGMLLGKHKRLRIRVMRGNHDETAHFAVAMALEGHYANEERVTVEDCGFDLFMHQWGDCATFAHHGDVPGKWEAFALHLSDICPFWSSTFHRTCFFGHGHKDLVRDFGAVRIEMLRPFTPLSKWAADMKFIQRRALHSITLDKRDGIVNRAMDPIRRPIERAA